MNWNTELDMLNEPDSPHPDPLAASLLPQRAPNQENFVSALHTSHPTLMLHNSSPQQNPYLGSMYYHPMHPPSHIPYPLHFDSGPSSSNPVTANFNTQPVHPYYPGYAPYLPAPQLVSSPPVLNQNGRATNRDSARTTGKRKKAASQAIGASNKRPRQTAAATAEPSAPSSICGVGPTMDVPLNLVDIENHDPNPTVTPTASPPCSTAPRYSKHPASATDVWYFMRALETEEEPAVKPTEEPIFTRKPKCKFIGCKLCADWKVWKHGDGMTDCLRTHLKQYHLAIYEATVRLKGLKYSSPNPNQLDFSADEPFSPGKFLDMLQRWLVADDQSVHVLECIEFRNLLLYLGAGKIKDGDIPHRHKMMDLILDAYKLQIKATADEFKHTEGCISLTTDLWSDPNLDSFMAITVHYYIRQEHRQLIRRNGLIAFRFVEGSHTGINLATHFIKVVEELEALGKLGAITMDNASNNNTMMMELERELDARGIPFDHNGNRIQCFPHIVNIACQTILAELQQGFLPHIKQPPMSDPPMAKELEDWDNYLNALEADLIGKCRNIVATCRASGQRRQALLKKIDDGNRTGYWKGKLDDGMNQIRPVQLLRDCETRWSATFNMIDRVLELYVAIRDFLLDLEQSDVSDLFITPLHKGVLQDIHQVLHVAHLAQELLSAEHTPTLSMALPVFETLIFKWKALMSTIPELEHFINLGVSKLEEYVGRARKTRLYALAMILNPGQKFTWFTENDKTGEDETNSQNWMLEAMLSFKQHQRATLPATPSDSQPRVTSPPRQSLSQSDLASNSLAHGYSRLQSLDVSIRRSSSFAGAQTLIQAPASSLHGQSTLAQSVHICQETGEDLASRKLRELAEDKEHVKKELCRYEAAGIVTSFENTGMVNIDQFWATNEYKYPFLFRVAMDVLPAQASLVPCERIFSSSKETCTLRRNCISRSLLEALQVLKFSYRSERLHFVEEPATEADYAISGQLTEAAVDELMAAGKFEELKQLIQNSSESS